jgi:hypothetical protein
MPVIQALRRLRQENRELEPSLSLLKQKEKRYRSNKKPIFHSSIKYTPIPKVMMSQGMTKCL